MSEGERSALQPGGTAEANGLEPWRYLNAVFERLPVATNTVDIDRLLPWRIGLNDHPGGESHRYA